MRMVARITTLCVQATNITQSCDVDHFSFAQPKLMYRDFTEAQENFVPLSLRDVNLQKSTVTWADVGGLLSEVRIEAQPRRSHVIQQGWEKRRESSGKRWNGPRNTLAFSHNHLCASALGGLNLFGCNQTDTSPVYCCTGTLDAERPCLLPRWQRSVASISSASKAPKS
jgi:hypothetical protein